jgi:hypothetical protein
MDGIAIEAIRDATSCQQTEKIDCAISTLKYEKRAVFNDSVMSNFLSEPGLQMTW